MNQDYNIKQLKISRDFLEDFLIVFVFSMTLAFAIMPVVLFVSLPQGSDSERFMAVYYGGFVGASVEALFRGIVAAIAIQSMKPKTFWKDTLSCSIPGTIVFLLLHHPSNNYDSLIGIVIWGALYALILKIFRNKILKNAGPLLTITINKIQVCMIVYFIIAFIADLLIRKEVWLGSIGGGLGMWLLSGIAPLLAIKGMPNKTDTALITWGVLLATVIFLTYLGHDRSIPAL